MNTSERLAGSLEEAGGGRVQAILLFGSRLVGASPEEGSAHDMVVIVDEYLPFYEALTAAGHHRRSPRVLSGLSRVLAPNVIAFFPSGREGEVAKCMILTREDFHLALSPEAPDHFVKGRMVQKVEVAYARDEAEGRRVAASLAGARREVLRWTAPWLDEPFTVPDLTRRMLEVSYAGEIRPEASERVEQVHELQEEHLAAVYGRMLGEAEEDGEVVGVDGGWRLADPPGALERLGWRLYFLRSKARATARWLKHVITYDDWLTYVQRKVERRTGLRVELTPMERRLPLLLLWPKAFRVLRAAKRAGDAAGRTGGRDDEA